MLPLIMGAIVAVIITSLKDNTIVTGRLADSASAQTTSAFYVRDVQSAAYLTTQQGSTPGPVRTVPPPEAIPSDLKFELGLTWGSPTAGGSIVSYWFNPNTGDLLRLYCAGGVLHPDAGQVTVAHGLALGTGLQTPVVTPASIGSQARPVELDHHRWCLRRHHLRSAIDHELPDSPFRPSRETRRRKASRCRREGVASLPPLLLLGSGTAPNYALNCTGNGTLNVNGAIQLNSSSNHSANVSGSGASITATEIYTADGNLNGVFDGNGQLQPKAIVIFLPGGGSLRRPHTPERGGNQSRPNNRGQHHYLLRRDVHQPGLDIQPRQLRL